MRRFWFLCISAPLALASWVACSGTSSSTAPPASIDAGIDASITCTSPLGDAGFSSLAELPIAAICAASYSGVAEFSCEGWTVVTGAEADCTSIWLFDATTGALEALSDYVCEDGEFACAAATPGFLFPNLANCLTEAVEAGVPLRSLDPCFLLDAGADAETGSQVVTDGGAGGG
jgi:hypothetical protein